MPTITEPTFSELSDELHDATLHLVEAYKRLMKEPHPWGTVVQDIDLFCHDLREVLDADNEE